MAPRHQPLVCILVLFHTTFGFIDTSKWFGAEYTPSSASNSLWWYYYDNYTSQIDNELNLIEHKFKFNSLRIFLHVEVYNVAGSEIFIKYIDSFLNKTVSHNMKAGFVFFDDCWNMSGANATNPCQPTPGVHNGCWMACPQSNQRNINNITQLFKGYVTDIIQHFATDNERILFWEIYNEPNSSPFSAKLRNTAYEWAIATDTSIPIISCWDNNNNTEISDMHNYGENFINWKKEILLGNNGNKGTVITEGGARWYPGYADSASPIEVINFLEYLQGENENGTGTWKPGIFPDWEVMVGNTNTRWHWNTPAYSPEPNIPWCGYLYPDGTVVSETEAGIIRKYITGKDEFILLDTFLPEQDNLTNDHYLTLNDDNNQWIGNLNVSSPFYIKNKYDLLIEFTFWPTLDDAKILLELPFVDESNSMIMLYGMEIDMKMMNMNLYQLSDNDKIKLATFNMSSLDCGVTAKGWNMFRSRVSWNWMALDTQLLRTTTNFSIWLNPMFEDSKQPRISYIDVYNVTNIQDVDDITMGFVELFGEFGTNDSVYIDYISVLSGNATLSVSN